ncbi:MAG: 2-hydroxyacyl-CoA dehydratase [Betaproteobacteria bacterium]|nr:2-hydroxyacyl-CoA dehydratase [Betaproteobacteria bacterium]
MSKFLRIGIDIGSTTVKTVVIERHGKILYKSYTRHLSEVRKTVAQSIDAMSRDPVFSDPEVLASLVITGSGGLQVAELSGVPFVQEVIACAKAVEVFVPQTDVAIELGGEDAKITFFTNGIEQRMNGSCAGGTGAFIDQMAGLLRTDAAGLNALAQDAKNLYPIAARCGVFAKTDVQPLLNEGVARPDIAVSVFQAVAQQTISGLACGRKIKGKVAFLGGPLNFLPELKKRFIETLQLTPADVVKTNDSELFVALGAALHGEIERAKPFARLLQGFSQLEVAGEREFATMRPFFADAQEREEFTARHARARVDRADLKTYSGAVFLGIDGGSTTTKAALTGENDELLYTYYGSNEGDPLAVVGKILGEVYERLPEGARIASSAVTGYGEAMIKAAFNLDHSEVETIAHYKAANHFLPSVDFILDIGGQDMKCIRVKNGVIDNILLNEACSSGCGSFLETFAQSVQLPIAEFAQAALNSQAPPDLGSRCTVFMNSSVKQAQKEGASVADISAGLSYAVVKNALIKVIKIKSPEELGERIIVQGGTFYNDAVLRAFELISQREAVRPDIAGLMGAYGAAIIARERWQGIEDTNMLTEMALRDFSVQQTMVRCGQCNIRCPMTVNRFSDKRKFVSGNRCERGLGHKKAGGDLPDLYTYKYELVFNYEPLENAPRGSIGIPRALNMYENYPLWFTFLTELGYSVVLSSESSKALLEKGMDTLPSDTICYPAKLVHGHIVDLVEKGVKTIFYPCVPYEQKEFADSDNHFNCPVVTSYPEQIRNNLNLLQEKEVALIQPFLSLEDKKKLSKRLVDIFKPMGFKAAAIRRALEAGWAEQERMKANMRQKGEETLAYLATHGGRGIILAGRPYHIDPEIHHGIPQIITGLGMAVLTEDSVAHLSGLNGQLRVVDQWTYHARLYRAASLAASSPALEIIHLNSFGCGLDSIAVDQVQEILERQDRIYTVLKIDEGNNLGAARIRIRSLKSALEERGQGERSEPEIPRQVIHIHPYRSGRHAMNVPDSFNKAPPARRPALQPALPRPVFTKKMREEYTIIAPQMSPMHFQFLETAFNVSGYRVRVLEEVTQKTTDTGLRYVNNDACYPSIMVVGQIVEALQSGKYDPQKTAVLISQTGGGCRATNYIGYLRRALLDSGFENIPVISLNAVGMERHEGFKLTLPLLNRLMMGIVYGDLLMQTLYRTRPYEREAGSADALYLSWVARCQESLKKGDFKSFRKNIHDIVADFDRLELVEADKPRVALVGEIFVKYHPSANNDLARAIEQEGAEVVIPGFMEFFLYCAYDYDFNHQFLSKGRLAALAGNLAIKAMEFYRKDLRRALSASQRFHPPHTIDELAFGAAPILSRGNQTGEGWFLTAEMVQLIEQGVSNIICMQPFACMPNHITGKGVIKALKDRYPHANITAVDYDPGASAVNQINRIKLMLAVAFGNMKKNRVSYDESLDIPAPGLIEAKDAARHPHATAGGLG